MMKKVIDCIKKILQHLSPKLNKSKHTIIIITFNIILKYSSKSN